MVYPASRGTQDLLASQESLPGWGRKVRMETQEILGHEVWKGRMDLQEHQVLMVFRDRKETR